MTSRQERFEALLRCVARLRDPAAGCPWDRAQDHRSLRPYMIEEAYETIAAIDAGDHGALCDELGDVLLQVVLHAQIASEAGVFDIQDVIRGLDEKLVRRHPHVFGQESDDDCQSIRSRWTTIKAGERQPKHGLPALIEARKLVSEQGTAVVLPARQASLDAETEAGMRLLATVAACWDEGVEPELALRKAMAALRARDSGAST